MCKKDKDSCKKMTKFGYEGWSSYLYQLSDQYADVILLIGTQIDLVCDLSKHL